MNEVTSIPSALEAGDSRHQAQRRETMRHGAVSAGMLCPFTLLLLALPPGRAAAPPDRGLTDTSSIPYVVVRSVSLADVKWTRGFWADRFETCRRSALPNLGRIIEGTEYSQFLHNFRIATGLEQGRHRGAS